MFTKYEIKDIATVDHRSINVVDSKNSNRQQRLPRKSTSGSKTLIPKNGLGNPELSRPGGGQPNSPPSYNGSQRSAQLQFFFAGENPDHGRFLLNTGGKSPASPPGFRRV